jgi:SM-20-related protein
VTPLSDLQQRAYLIWDQGFEPELVAALHGIAQRRRGAGGLREASVGRGGQRQRIAAIRGDSIAWLEPDDPEHAVRTYFERMENIRVALNRELYIGVQSLEAHIAHYPPGTGYARHLDRFRDDDARVISSVLYLNPAWEPAHAGELRLFPDGEPPVDVAPCAGRLVLFLSGELEHEVLPTQVDRYSIAGWMRRRI